MLKDTTLKQASTFGPCRFSVRLMKLGTLYMRPKMDSDFEIGTSDIKHGASDISDIEHH